MDMQKDMSGKQESIVKFRQNHKKINASAP